MDVVDQRLLQFALVGLVGELEEVKDVGVLGRLKCRRGISLSQRCVEVSQGGALAFMQSQMDLRLQVAARPSVRGCFARVPCVCIRLVGERVDQYLMVGPANLCSQWLHSFGLGPDGGEAAHVEDVSAREPAVGSGRGSEVFGDPSDDVVAPARGLLLFEDVAADRPVQHHQLGVERPRSPRLGLADAKLEALEQRSIPSGRCDVLDRGARSPCGRLAHRSASRDRPSARSRSSSTPNARSSRSNSSGRSLALTYRSVVASLE